MRERKPNQIRDKTYSFALEIVKFCISLQEKHEFVLSKQLLKSGTSIGANVEEAIQAESKADFVHKLSISLKEAHETDYWLRLIKDSGYDILVRTPALRESLDGIIAILTVIIKNSKRAHAGV